MMGKYRLARIALMHVHSDVEIDTNGINVRWILPTKNVQKVLSFFKKQKNKMLTSTKFYRH